MERGSRVTKAMLTSGELAEVPRRTWHDVVKELEGDATRGFIVDCNVELSWVSSDIEMYVWREYLRRRLPWWIVCA